MVGTLSSALLSTRKAALVASVIGFLLLIPTANADNGELSKFVEATEKGLSEATLIKIARAQGKIYRLSNEEAAALIRSSVSVELIRVLTSGKSPTSFAISMAGHDGPNWSRLQGGVRELEDEYPDLERLDDDEDDPLHIKPRPTKDTSNNLAVLTTTKAKGKMGIEGPWYVDGHEYWTYVDGYARMAFAVRTEGRLTLLCISITNSGASQVTVFPDIFRLAVRTWGGFQELPAISATEVAQKARNRMMWGQMFSAMTTQAIAGVQQSNLTNTERAAVGAVRGLNDVGSQVLNSTFQNEYARSLSLADMVLRVNTLGKNQNVSGILMFEHDARPGQSFRLVFNGIDGPIAIDLRTRDE
jgi:hypothetical protein